VLREGRTKDEMDIYIGNKQTKRHERIARRKRERKIDRLLLILKDERPSQ
jgi:hypothetical protein